MTQADFDFPQLQEIAATLDGLLDDVKREMEEWLDPDGMGVFDRGEAIVGLGLVACQNYLVARKGQRARSVYDLGPLHGSQMHFARIVNEGANYWKHRPEWPDDVTDLNPLQRRSYDVLNRLGVWHHDYKVTNLLYELVQDTKLAPLVSRLAEWREALDPGGFMP